MGLQKVGTDLGCLPVGADRLAVISLQAVGVAGVEVGRTVFGIDLQHLGEGGERVAIPLLFEITFSQRQQGILGGGGEPAGIGEGLLRLDRVSLLEIEIAESLPGDRVLGMRFDRQPVTQNRLLPVPQLPVGVGQFEVGVVKPGIDGGRFLQGGGRLLPAPPGIFFLLGLLEVSDPQIVVAIGEGFVFLGRLGEVLDGGIDLPLGEVNGSDVAVGGRPFRFQLDRLLKGGKRVVVLRPVFVHQSEIAPGLRIKRVQFRGGLEFPQRLFHISGRQQLDPLIVVKGGEVQRDMPFFLGPPVGGGKQQDRQQ